MVGVFAETRRALPSWADLRRVGARLDLYRLASWGFVALGALLCLTHFAGRRSFWIDEAMLGLNLKYLSLPELAGKLDYNQVAPIGWLYLQKGFYELTHDFETGLRITSLVAVITALVLFRNFVFRELSKPGALAATMAFALSGTVLRYAVELKPYGLDVLLTVTIMSAAARLLKGDKFERGAVALLAAAGFATVFFSFAAVFVLGACTGVVIVQKVLQGRRADAGLLIGMSLAWLLDFGWLYATVYHTQASGSDLVAGGSNAFFSRTSYAPLPPTSLADVKWYANWTETFFSFGFGRDSMFAAILMVAIGLFALARRSLWLFAMVAGSLSLAFVASSLKLYPLYDRLALFLLPCFFVAIGAAAGLVAERAKGAAVGGLALTLLVVAASGPAIVGNMTLGPPYADQHVRPVIDRLRRDIAPGDVIFVNNFGIPAYLLYAPERGLIQRSWVAGTLGSRNWSCTSNLFPAVQPGNSVWLLYVMQNDPEKWPAALSNDRGLKGDLKLETAAAQTWLYRLRVREAAGAPGAGPSAACVDNSNKQKFDAPPRLLARAVNGA